MKISSNHDLESFLQYAFDTDWIGETVALFATAIRTVTSDNAALFRWTLKPVEKGAETVVYLASSPEFEGITGCYLQNKKNGSLAEHARDEAAARILWDTSEQLTAQHLLDRKSLSS